MGSESTMDCDYRGTKCDDCGSGVGGLYCGGNEAGWGLAVARSDTYFERRTGAEGRI